MKVLHMNAGAEEGGEKHILFHFYLNFQRKKWN